MPRAGNGPVGVRPPKRRARPKPATSSPIFGPVAAPNIERRVLQQAGRAGARAGKIVAARPGVQAALKPGPRPTSAAQRAAVIRRVSRGATSVGLSAQERGNVAATNTAPGRALRQGQRAQQSNDRLGARQVARRDLIAHPDLTPVMPDAPGPLQRRPVGQTIRENRALTRRALAGPSTARDRADLTRYGRAIPNVYSPRAKAGPTHNRIGIPGVATIDTTALGHNVANFAVSHGIPRQTVGFVGRLAKDARDFPKTAVQAGYEFAAGAVETTQARPQRMVRLLKGQTQGVIGQTVGAVGAGLRGDADRAQKDLQGAIRTFSEHPLYGALELSGAYSVAGRTAGAAMRSGLIGKRARRAAATKRASARAAEGIEFKRTYSKNAITGAVQKGHARRKDANAKVLAQDAFDQAIREGKTPAQAEAIRRSTAMRFGSRGVGATTISRPRFLRTKKNADGNTVFGPQRPRVLGGPGGTKKVRGKVALNGVEKAMQKHADEFVSSVIETPRRHERAAAARAGARALPTSRAYDLATRRGRAAAAIDRAAGKPRVKLRGPGGRVIALSTRPENHVLRIVAEQVTRKADVLPVLRAERARLDQVFRAERSTMTTRTQRRNRDTVAAIDALLRHKNAVARADRLWESVGRYDAVMKPLTEKLKAKKVLEAGQAAQAVLRPIAVGRMGGRYDHSMRVRPEEAAVARRARARAGEASAAARRAEAEVTRAQVARAKASGGAARGRGATSMAKIAAAKSTPNRARAVNAYIESVQRAAEGTATGRRYYRGVRGNGSRTGGKDWWDNHTFMSHDRATAKGYAYGKTGKVQELIVRPGARILERGTAKYDAFLTTHGLHRDETTKTAQLAEKAGYDVVDFKQGDLGAIVLNEKALDHGPPMDVRNAARRERADQMRLDAADARIVRAKAARKAARKTAGVRKAEARAVRAKPKVVGFVDPHGVRLSEAEIKRRLDAETRTGSPHERMPAFVGQSDRKMGARAGYVNAVPGRRNVDQFTRTGEATRAGSSVTDPIAIVESAISAQGTVSAVKAWDSVVGQYVQLGPDGKGMSPRQAQALIASQPRDAPELVMVRTAPGTYSAERIKEIEDWQKSGLPLPDDLMASLTSDLFKNALVNPMDRGVRNVGVMPKAVYDRILEHQTAQASDIAKMAQKVTNAFRGTVLPFSIKWITGNVAEAILRLGAEGVVPVRDALIGKKLIRTMFEEDAKRSVALQEGAGSAQAMLDRSTGGLLFGTQTELGINRAGTDFTSAGIQAWADRGGAVIDAPIIRHGLMGLHGYQNAVFGLNKGFENRMIEHAFGKLARREVQDMTGSWLKSLRMGEQAYRDLANGLLDSNTQAAFARSIDGILGQYNRFSPSTKRIIQTAAPFLPWYLNAVKFVYYTLPHGHPIKTALLARAEQTFANDWNEANRDTPPGDLTSALIGKDGGYYNVARYTPFGAFTGTMPGIALDPFLPQIQSVWEIAHGRSWTGKPLQIIGPDGKKMKATDLSEGQIAGLALYSFIESVLPGIQMARRLQEGGSTAYDNSFVWSPKTKPDSSYGQSAANRVFNPARPTYLRPPSGRGSGRGSGGGVAGARVGGSSGGSSGMRIGGSSGGSSGMRIGGG